MFIEIAGETHSVQRNTDASPLLRVQLDDVPIGHGVIGAYLLAVELSASPHPREP